MEVAMEGGISTLQQLVCKVNNNIPAECMKPCKSCQTLVFLLHFSLCTMVEMVWVLD